MSQQDELSKREEDRINRTLNNIGRRTTARPVSWNVPQTTGLNGTVGSMGRRDGVANLKAIQDQIREEERRQAQQAQHVHPGHPQYVYPPPEKQAPPVLHVQTQHSSQQVHQYNNGHATSPTPTSPSGENVESEAERDRKMRQEEERLERQMRKGGWKVEDDKSKGSNDHAASHDNRPTAAVTAEVTAAKSAANLSELAAKFQEQILQAAKALRQKRSEEVVKRSFGVVTIAKAIAEALSDDGEILSYAKALEAGASLLRTNLDSGGDGQQHYYEISGYLGQIFITTIGAV